MIFSAKHGMYQKTLVSEKILTTRLKLPAHIREGAEWAIVPQRAAPAWWIGERYGQAFIVTDPRAYLSMQYPNKGYVPETQSTTISKHIFECGFTQARIIIDAFWQTPLQDMTEQEARNEGVKNVAEYSALWDKINDKAGVRWRDNPTGYRIAYHTPLDLHVAVMRVGREAIFSAANPVLETA